MTARKIHFSQVIQWSGYWRCDVKPCSKCKLIKPLAEFGKRPTLTGLSWQCRKCANEKSTKWRKRNKKAALEVARRFRERHPERVKSAREKWMKKIGIAEYQLRQKLNRVAREMREGISWFKKNDRTPRGRMLAISRHIKRTYKFQCGAEDCWAQFGQRDDFRSAFRKWRESQWDMAYAPCARASRKKVKSLADFEIVRFGLIRSNITKRAWRDGDYANRPKAPRPVCCVLGRRSVTGQFVRAEMSVDKSIKR